MKVSVNLPEAVHAKLVRIARRDGKGVTEMMRKILIEHIEKLPPS